MIARPKKEKKERLERGRGEKRNSMSKKEM